MGEKMTGLPGKPRFILILLGVAVLIGATVPAFLTASCFTQQNTPAEIKALENLRSQTRRDQLPADEVVARIEADFPRTKAAGLARLVRARIKVRANDYAGAATLLDTKVIHDYTSLGDHALFMRGNALEQTGQTAVARIVYEQLIRNHPNSIRSREATLRVADILLKSGQAAAIPLLLKDLTSKDDAAALLLAAKASSQSGDNVRTLESYRRIYFFAPASSESAQAQTMIPQLSSTLVPLNQTEATARAEKLFDARRYNDAYQAYTEALSKFPALANTGNQLRRGIAAANARRTEAAAVLSSLTSLPPRVRPVLKLFSIWLKHMRELVNGNKYVQRLRSCGVRFPRVVFCRVHLSALHKLLKTPRTMPMLLTSGAPPLLLRPVRSK
jgi:soluble lytic murein transglycosylase